MDLCKLALIILLAAFVFYLVVSLCGKKEGFCAGSAVVRNNRSGYYPGVGRSIAGENECGGCPTQQKCANNSYIKRYGCPNYVIEGMDSPEKVAQYVAKKTLANLKRHQNPCSNPDNKWPAGNPMAIARGGSADGRFAITGEQLQEYQANVERDFPATENFNETENFGTEDSSDNFYESFEEQGNDKESFQNSDLTAEVAPCGSEGACGLPETMFNDKCGDPNTYVYDRQIAVVAKSRTYGQGNYLLGDLPICPAVFKDQYGVQVFNSSARPSSDLNAGALRFIGGSEVNLTNVSGDILAYRQGGTGSNVGVQYAMAG